MKLSSVGVITVSMVGFISSFLMNSASLNASTFSSQENPWMEYPNSKHLAVSTFPFSYSPSFAYFIGTSTYTAKILNWTVSTTAEMAVSRPYYLPFCRGFQLYMLPFRPSS